MYNYILFDLDGTLTDPKVGITECVRYSLPFVGIDPPETDSLLGFIGPPLVDSYMKYFDLSKEQSLFALEKYRERFSAVGMFENSLYDGIPQMLSSLFSAGKTLAVASLKPEPFVKKILAHFDIEKYFSAICGSDFEGKKHTKFQIISEALNKLDVAKEHLSEVLMVGDRENDILGAKEAGIHSAGVRFGYAFPGELEAAGATHILSAPEEITQIVLEN